MRLYTMYYLCKNNMEAFKNVEGRQTNTNRDEYRVAKWPEIKQGIDNLYSILSLREHLNDVYQIVPTAYKYLDYVDFNKATLDRFNIKLNKLNTSIQTIVELYESLGYNETENNLEVKIPDGIELNKLVKLFGELDFVLNQCPIIDRDGNTSTVVKTDVGSIWFILAGTAAFLKSVGYIVNVTIKARADLASIKELEALCIEMSAKADVAQVLTSTLKEKKDVVMRKYVDEIKTLTGKTLNPEEEDKVEKCISKLDDLLESGVKVYAAINTPREIQVLFPEQPDLKLLPEDAIKLIEMNQKEPE